MRLLGLFPGQGSQKVGMGRDLWERFDLAKELFAVADERLGFALSRLCFDGPAEELMRTEITQPAILTVSTICYRLALAEGCPLPLAAAGHSLGEYSALVAAEALRFEDAVLLVHKRGRYMQEAVPAGRGKMLAVLGKEPGEIEEVLARVEGCVQIANVNAPGQIVVAGEAEAVDRFVGALPGAKTIPLPVSAPFHCSLMAPAEERLRKDLAELSIRPARFPIYANYHAKPLTNPEDIREALALQVCGRVRWVECMEAAFESTDPEAAVEFGSGSVLTGLLKRIKPDLKRVNAGSVDAVVGIGAALG